MNSSNTSHTANILNELPYLNQTSRYIIGGQSKFAKTLNTSYQLIWSFIDASRTHREQSLESSDTVTNFKPFIDFMGFFFSSYAMICLIASIIINRIVTASSIRSRDMTLPHGLKQLMHLSTMLALIVCMIELIVSSNPDSLTTFILFSGSYIIETIATVTSNQIPLEGTDYSVFELALQFYMIHQNINALHLSPLYLADNVMALATRFLVHFVELLNIRKSRLRFSIVMDCIYLGYMGYFIFIDGIDNVPIFIIFRHLPKMFYLFMIIVSLFCYSMAVIIRWDPSHNYQNNIEELQFYPFMHNWWGHLNFSGEEDASNAVSRLGLFLCLGSESKEKGFHREFPNLNVPQHISDKFTISKYLNKIEFSERNTISRKSHKAVIKKTSNFLSTVLCPFRFLMKLVFNAKSDSISDALSSGNQDNTSIKIEHIGKYDILMNDEVLLSEYLSSDEDSEYIPEEDISDELSLYSETDESLQGEEYPEEHSVFDLVTDSTLPSTAADIDWLSSVRAITNSVLSQEKPLTRSEYFKLTCNIDETDHDQPDNVCVVCKTNVRHVVLWPCKCFALCEDCRVSLGLRGYENCICCRRPVHGYSKVRE